MKQVSTFFLIGILALSACGSPQPEAVVQTEGIYYVHITPALRPFWPAVQTCAAQQEDAVIVIQERFYDPADVADLTIHLGEPPELPAFSAPLAHETIVAVVNAQNPVSDLSPRQVQDIFHAAANSWADFGGKGAIQVWALLEGDETRQHFEHLVLQPLRLTPNTRLAPDEELLAQSVSEDPAAIGYLPGAWVNEQLKAIELGIQLPVLALANSEPPGVMRDLLVCIQGDTGQIALPESYSPLP